MIKQRTYTVIGSFYKWSSGDTLYPFLINNVFIDPRTSTPMEMDAYSIYNSLIIENVFFQVENENLKNKVKDAITNRLKEFNCKLVHNSWGYNELHLRYSAAAIKLVVELVNEDRFNDIKHLIKLIEHHLTYRDELNKGIWFLHDSNEKDLDEYHDYYFKNNLFGSSSNTILVLNTHLDTINSLLFLLCSEKVISRLDLKVIENWFKLVIEGIIGLEHVLKNQRDHIFYLLDSYIRDFNAPKSDTNEPNYILHKYFYRLRLPFKNKYPLFFHKDGYIEREISLAGVGINYHIINLSDICKFIILCKRYDLKGFVDLIKYLLEKVEKGINYILQSKSYKKYLKEVLKNKSVEICEVILSSLYWKKEVDPSWINLYSEVREYCTPTPGLSGYDGILNPFLVKSHLVKYVPSILESGCDIFSTKVNELIIINPTSIDLKVTVEDLSYNLTSKSVARLQF